MKIKFSQKLAFSAAGFAIQAGSMFIATFMLIYLTDVIGMNAGIVGSILMITKIFDGVTDFIMGFVLDKTHTKIGKARPWIAIAALPINLTVYMLFAVPESLTTVGQIIYVFVVYFLYSAVFLTMGSLSWNSLIALMTDDDRERVITSSISSVIAMIGCLLAIAMSYPLVAAAGGGRQGWKITAGIFALVFAVFMIWAAIGIKENNNPDVNENAVGEVKTQKNSSLPAKQLLSLLVKNKYFWCMLIFNIIYNFLNSVSGTGTYYVKYILHNESLVTISAAMNSVTTFISIVFFAALLKKISKQSAMIAGMLFIVAASIIKLVGPYSTPCYLVGGMFLGLGLGANVCASGALLADVVEYTFNLHKIKIEGMLYSCTSIGVKVGSALGSGVLGWILAWAGYDGTLAVQPESALNALIVMTSILPLVFAIICAIVLTRMDVEKKLPQYANKGKKKDNT